MSVYSSLNNVIMSKINNVFASQHVVKGKLLGITHSAIDKISRRQHTPQWCRQVGWDPLGYSNDSGY